MGSKAMDTLLEENNPRKTSLSALTILHAEEHGQVVGAGKAAAIKRVSERLVIIQAKDKATEVVDPLEAIPVPDAQAVTHHNDFRHGDQVCICGVYYRVQKTTRRDLVLRRLRPTEIQR
jgi:hypothetical protein